ncbi:acetylglutamate kinase [Geomicrobium sediminis]|uniref:Acetylglutamate kinase n=1 Tax=Geomicrobium sediminis TaxID=1347788 RepID=A0ABS2P814_9BACL|nr:acetylglutamate kinase [Geomicrobium sediminis]MBM7631553.1 acetylglutamate kinase [Geomicrobium sediminis]
MSSDYVVIKCGGSVVNKLSAPFFLAIKELQDRGKKLVIVHGGGSDVNDMLETMDVTSTFVDGLRKTTPEVMAVADLVFNGKVNPAICRGVQKAGMKSVGLSGYDGPLIQAKLLDEKKFGLVGVAEHVDPTLIELLAEAGYVPVISPIVAGPDGMRLNMNADTAASHYASALKAEEIVFVTDVPGIMKDDQLIDHLTDDEVNTLMEDGTIYGGMIPKVKAALHSLSGRIQTVRIVGAYSRGLGTSITKQVQLHGS